MQALAAAEHATAQAAQKTAQGHTLAAGSVANLTAQFNDIGMMLMAGQNPLQLAVQQGTQITQVIGPMGAAGAARALGSAFVSMINPVSLITVGSIAAALTDLERAARFLFLQRTAFDAETAAAREQGYQRWEIRDAISKRYSSEARSQRPAPERNAAHHMPGVQPSQAQEAGSVFGGHVR